MFQLKQSIELCFKNEESPNNESKSKNKNLNLFTPSQDRNQLYSSSHLKMTKKIKQQGQPEQKFQEHVINLINQFKQQEDKIEQYYQSFQEKILNKQPQQLLFRQEQISKNEKKQRLSCLKQAMTAVMACNDGTISQDKSKFLMKNSQLEKSITELMEGIQLLDEELQHNFQEEEEAIKNLQKIQLELKKFLKKKADINEIELIQKQRKQKMIAVRRMRESIRSLKDKKIGKIKLIMKQLNNLNEHRREAVREIEVKYFCNLQSNQINIIIEDFKQKLRILKVMEENHYSEELKNSQILTGRSSLSNLNKRSSISSSTISPFDVNQNHIKQMHQLKSCQPPFTPKNIQTAQLSYEFIISKYEQILESYIKVEKMKKHFLQKKKSCRQKMCELLLMEKCYLDGIMNENSRELNTEKKLKLINNAAEKCDQFQKILNVKNKEKFLVEQKIRNIENTLSIFQHNLELMLSQQQIKQKLFKDIQKTLHEVIAQQNSNKIKDFHKEMQKMKMRRSMLEKDLQEYAQVTNLQGYKQTKMKITKLQAQIIELQNKSQQLPIRKQLNEQYLKQVQNLIQQSSITGAEFLSLKISSNNPMEILQKAKKRLLTI